ncbi:hypothetical protein PLICRDRAFT_52790 [Plicaturopsis crispa FD-325 SS-3]|nr:hypothetical protein PLICRDRAFT_52790 [Plicaturopsis crispa FD-325 SS-3]
MAQGAVDYTLCFLAACLALLYTPALHALERHSPLLDWAYAASLPPPLLLPRRMPTRP